MPPVPRDDERAQAEAVAEKVRRYRQERGYSLSELARRAGLAKSYISSIEHGEAPRPSGRTLYAVAEALGVTMSDLLGRRLLSQATTDRPESLKAFAEEHNLPEADIQMLASINFRGDQPLTKQRWAHIYSAIRGTEWMDRSDNDDGTR